MHSVGVKGGCWEYLGQVEGVGRWVPGHQGHVPVQGAGVEVMLASDHDLDGEGRGAEQEEKRSWVG